MNRYAVPIERPPAGRDRRPRSSSGPTMARLALLACLSLVLVTVGGTSQVEARHLTQTLQNFGEPVNDHYVENGTFADTNFAQGFVRFGTGSGTNIRRGFVEWDLSALPAETGTIVSASIAVFQSSSPISGFEALFCFVTESWSESTINFTNQPAVGTCPATFDVQTTGGLKNVSLDPSFVSSWFTNPATNFGLRINMSDESSAIFGSNSAGWEGKEASEPHPGDTTPSPTLYVTFTLTPTQTEVIFPVLAVVGAVVVAFGFFNLAVNRKERKLEDLATFLILLLVFVVGISVAVAFVLT